MNQGYSMRADHWAIDEEDEAEEGEKSEEEPVEEESRCDWTKRPVDEFISRRQGDVSAPQSRRFSPILSSRNKTSQSPARTDKHVRLTLPNTTPNGGLGGGNGAGGGGAGAGRYRRRRAVSTADFKSCALIQSKMKLGDIM